MLSQAIIAGGAEKADSGSRRIKNEMVRLILPLPSHTFPPTSSL
jgi:hypothetical protein